MRQTEDQTCEWNAATSNDINYTCAIDLLWHVKMSTAKKKQKKQPRIGSFPGRKRKWVGIAWEVTLWWQVRAKTSLGCFFLGTGDACRSRPDGGSRFSFTGVHVLRKTKTVTLIMFVKNINTIESFQDVFVVGKVKKTNFKEKGCILKNCCLCLLSPGEQFIKTFTHQMLNK